MFRQRRKETGEEVKHWGSPLEELTYLLDELEKVVTKSKDDYIMSIAPPMERRNRRSSVMDSLKKFRRKSAEMEDLGEIIPPTTPSSVSGSRTTKSSFSDSHTPNSSSNTNSNSNTNSRLNSKVVPETPPSIPATPKSENGRSPMSFISPRGTGESDAKIIPMSPQQEAHCVELVRRLAELVVIGERAAATAQQHKDKLDRLKEKQKWGEEIMTEDDEATLAKARCTDSDIYIAIFEHFFERNGLALITNILTGAAFDLQEFRERQKKESSMSRSVHSDDSELDDDDIIRAIDFDQHDYFLLPPLSVATQAIQSVSILVQNVSRATSLFFILSNNHVNQLINFPLDRYYTAERKRQNQWNESNSRRFGSPELAELTTHFITFLKSLALRMNTETLQFFLTYPPGEDGNYFDKSLFTDNNPQDMDDADHDSPMDEIASNANKKISPDKIGSPPVPVRKIQVEFPLYERALEFCAAHQDSFVRVTAMNICLNTLRLATVQPAEGTEDPDEPGAIRIEDVTGSSPDGVLHNAKPLPVRERLAIAQYVCTPSRVERLVSPIFTKLAQFWGILEEQFRDMDDGADSGADKDADKFGRNKSPNDKVAKAKETARRKKVAEAFNSTAYNVQDELLLLDDVLRVGISSLNEQTIEMMFATYVYPLLLQPLLLYFQRSPVPDEVLFADPLNDHSAGRGIKTSDLKAGEKSLISAPAKSAFFSLAAVFQLLRNAPLLRLLFTALFHPLAPHATGETMIRAKADVACVGPDGKVSVRIDPIDSNGKIITPSDRSTYIFGTVTGKKCASGATERLQEDDKDTCVFVLSPALSEILEFKGDDASLIARTRKNPYRSAIFKCFTLSSQLSDLRPLSVMVFDAAVSAFDEKFVSSILFGLDLKKYEDTVPLDERKYDKMEDLDDRGIGGGVSSKSRMNLGDSGVGALWHNYMADVILSFRSCLLKAVPASNGSWKLEYDLVAAHALLCAVRGDTKALKDAAIGIDRRCRQAAGFLADIPASVAETMEDQTTSPNKRDKKPNGNDKNDSEKRKYEIMDFLFRGHGLLEDTPAVLTDLVELKPAHRVNDTSGYSVKVSMVGSYDILCGRCSAFTPFDGSEAEAALNNAMASARAWAKLDAFSTLLNSLVGTNGDTVSKKTLGGLAAKRDGTFVATFDASSIYAPLSEPLLKALFEEGRGEGYVDARPGTVVSLVGQTALPCVCEVPPSSAPLFSEAGAKVVSQGITWQSLYLVLLGRNLVLAEPERRSSGDGRVVTCCKLERVSIEVDSTHISNDTSARRLVVSHDGPELDPPGLFLFEISPTPKDEGAYSRFKLWRSSLDVWFEDSQAVELAQLKVNGRIAEAKLYRGKRLQRYLAQGEDSGYPLTISFGLNLGDTI